MEMPMLQPAHLASLASSEDELDLRIYWNIFNKYKWQIIGLTLLIGLLTTLVTLSLPPIYRATVTLLIEFEQPKIIGIEEVYGISSANKDYYQTQLEILKSRSLVETVVDKLNLVSHNAVNQDTTSRWFDWQHWLGQVEEPATTPTFAQKQAAIVNKILANLSVEPVRNTQLAKISFESKNAQLAADVANTLANLYIETDLNARIAMTKKATALLTERINDLRQKLSQSEQTLQTYLEEHQLVNVEGVKSVAIKQIEEMASNLVKAHRQLAETQSAYQQVQALRGQASGAFESITAVINNPLVQRLKEIELDAERKVSELSKRYGSKHPKMIAATTELKTARANTTKQIRQVVTGITKEYEVALANVQALEQALKEKEEQIQDINRNEYQLGVLQREVEVNRQLYDLFLTRFKETDASQDIQALQSKIGQVIEPALVASTPYKPRKKLIVAISLALGLLFSTLLAFLLEYLDNTIKNGEDVEQKLGLPLLGTLPKLRISPHDQLHPQLMFLEQQTSQFAESVRTIRTGIMLSNLDMPRKVLVITSSAVSEGKTTFAINQALALGQMEKTLLIDADMRRPSIASVFGFTDKIPGLSELVAGTKSLDECIHPVMDGNIDCIHSGLIPPNPLELLASNRFQELLTQLEKHYGYIVIDSAPTLAVSDALILATKASAIVYVVKADATPYQMAKEGLKRLHQVDVPVLGIVLNQINTQKLSHYYGNKYGYYSKYGHYSYANR
jgi:capsular exopolysaccharide synthesis family protein